MMQTKQTPSWLHPQSLQPMVSSGNDGSRSIVARGGDAAPPSSDADLHSRAEAWLHPQPLQPMVSSGNDGSRSNIARGGDAAPPSSDADLHSRAEDIMCLRTSYVARQQTP